jgi:KDO2-lipid IV(A) lauroyltransferase
LTDAQVDRLVRAVYRHFCTMVFEMVWMPRKFHRTNLERYLRYPDPEEYAACLRLLKGDGLRLIVLGHLGNWEMFAYACGLAGLHGAVVARRLDNPYLDRFLTRFRIATGQTILDKNRDYEKIKEQLDHGRFLGIIGDQDAGPRGLFVDFFGRPASTHKSIALWSLEYSAPVMVFGATRRDRPLHYDLHLADVIWPEEYQKSADPVRDITQRFTSALEKLIRVHPDQYFWLHRRWKHQPPVRREHRRAG